MQPLQVKWMRCGMLKTPPSVGGGPVPADPGSTPRTPSSCLAPSLLLCFTLFVPRPWYDLKLVPTQS